MIMQDQKRLFFSKIFTHGLIFFITTSTHKYFALNHIKFASFVLKTVTFFFSSVSANRSQAQSTSTLEMLGNDFPTWLTSSHLGNIFNNIVAHHFQHWCEADFRLTGTKKLTTHSEIFFCKLYTCTCTFQWPARESHEGDLEIGNNDLSSGSMLV